MNRNFRSLALPLVGAALASLTGVQAQLAGHGPLLPDNGFPESYTDSNGLVLGLCLEDIDFCLLEGDLPIVSNPALSFPDNYGGTFPPEAFWWLGEAAMPTNGGGQALLVMAIEAFFVDEIIDDGRQTSFARLRIRIDNLVAGQTYTVTTPYGVFNLVAQSAGVRGVNFTNDVGRIGGDFVTALSGDIEPTFLTWDSDLPLFDLNGNEYVGNPTIDHTVTGSPFGTNFFRVEGPDVGGPGVNMVETDLFAIIGRKQGDVEPPLLTVADFSPDVTAGDAPLAVQFSDLSTANVTSWSWNFGDGGTSSLQNPAHVYTTPGVYSVSLLVTSPDGNDTNIQGALITVNEVIEPPAGLTLSLSPGTAGVPNSMTVENATPAGFVAVVLARQLGATVLTTGRCPGGINFDVRGPRLLGTAGTNPVGTAVLINTPPAAIIGLTFHLQAVDMATCEVTNVVTNIF